MGKESTFSEAGRRIMVKAPSEAVRPSLNVTIQEDNNENSLSHHGETEVYVKRPNEQDKLNKHEEQSSSSTDKKIIRSRPESEQAEEGEGRKGEEDDQDGDEEEAQEPVTKEHRRDLQKRKERNTRRHIYLLENGVNIA